MDNTNLVAEIKERLTELRSMSKKERKEINAELFEEQYKQILKKLEIDDKN